MCYKHSLTILRGLRGPDFCTKGYWSSLANKWLTAIICLLWNSSSNYILIIITMYVWIILHVFMYLTLLGLHTYSNLRLLHLFPMMCVCTSAYVMYVLCVRDLAEGVGLSIPIEVVSEPPAERQQHDLDGQTEWRSLGWGCDWRNRLGRRSTLTGGQRPLRYEVITSKRR